jgi:hypothetical protein
LGFLIFLEQVFQATFQTKIMKEGFWILSNICSGQDDQCFQVFNREYLMKKLCDTIKNESIAEDVLKEACFAYSNILVKHINEIRRYALSEEAVDILLRLERYSHCEMAISVIIESLHELYLDESFPEIVL